MKLERRDDPRDETHLIVWDTVGQRRDHRKEQQRMTEKETILNCMTQHAQEVKKSKGRRRNSTYVHSSDDPQNKGNGWQQRTHLVPPPKKQTADWELLNRELASRLSGEKVGRV